MELQVEEQEGLKRKLLITVPADVVSSRVDQAYKDLNKQIRMPGFRPGKIPLAILEQQAPIQSFTQMFQEMMQEYYEKALQESGLTPAGQPELENTQLDEMKKDAPFKFSVTLHIKPDINVKVQNYKGTQVKRMEAQVSDMEMESAILDLLVQYGHMDHHEEGHEIEKHDFVSMDFEGFFDGEPLEGGDSTGYRVRIGEKKMIEGFEDQLVGHKVGDEFEVKVTLPANWNNKVRRIGMPVPGAEDGARNDMANFNVVIKEVKKQILPELDDEIAGREGFDNLEKLRQDVKARLQMMKEQKEELRIKEDLFNRLVDENKFDPPESLIQRELKFMIEGMKYQIQQSGMKVEDSGFDEERALEEWRERALFNTRGYMLLEAVASEENIHVTQDDLEEEYNKLAEQTGKKAEEVKAGLMSNPDSIAQTTSKLLGQKAMNHLFSHCEFEYVKELPQSKEETPEK
jgi:trigger factor